ncbi:MAG: tripartite tricarboxylate transporter substrate binding protein [Hyphomicrobiales bacterium]|nr:tripartite tricarboxylate transporter substrate binding protein [Hyphomicrobiales bacterium]
MSIARREFIGTLLACSLSAGAARAQSYPARPVRIVVPFPPGGSNDLFARLIGQWLSERLGQPFVIENRPGAGTNIGTEIVARSAPDGHTLLLAFSANAINASLYQKLSFDFLRDFAPVASVVRQPLVVLVSPSFPATSLPELVAHGKQNPGRLNMASAGVGTPSHVAGELLQMTAGFKMVHVPYRGSGPAITDLLGGVVQVILLSPAASIEQVRAGKLRALAITSAGRWAAFPEIPAVGEFVPGYEATMFYGLAAPANTPAEVISMLNKEVNLALADPKIRQRLASLDGEVLAGSPEAFRKLIAEETQKWARVIKAAGVKPD